MKKKFADLKYTESFIVILIWLAVIAAPLFIFQEDYTSNWDKVYAAWARLLPFMILFLINHFLLVPFLLFKRRKAGYFLAAFVLLLLFSSTMYLVNRSYQGRERPGQEMVHQRPPERPERMPPREGMPPPGKQRRPPVPFPPLVNTIIIGVLVLGFDTGLRMMVRWSELDREKAIMEKENVQNQLTFLQNQVSPHFLMNTLNNIHALIDIDTEEAKNAIIKLSKLMRHLLYDSQAELIPLVKEIEFIQSYINLMKLRFSERVKITVSVEEGIPDKSIPPLLFTSFVENAFKHGISHTGSAYIDIHFASSSNELTFEIKNSNPGNDNESESPGIGLENSRKRLELIYGDKYKLDIKNENDEYHLILKIPV